MQQPTLKERILIAIRLMLRPYSSCYKSQNMFAIKPFLLIYCHGKETEIAQSVQLTRPSARRSKNRGSREEILLPSETSKVNRGAHPASYSRGTMGASSKEADLPSPSISAVVKNAWSPPHRTICTAQVQRCLYIV
jgi:hypothetical protein